MATIAPTVTELPPYDGSVKKYTWTPLTETNTDGAPIEMGPWADRSVQVEGTFGGATVTIQGTNDGTNWQTLNNPASVALSFSAAGFKGILELPMKIRPLVTGGTSVSLTVSMVVRRSNPMRT